MNDKRGQKLSYVVTEAPNKIITEKNTGVASTCNAIPLSALRIKLAVFRIAGEPAYNTSIITYRNIVPTRTRLTTITCLPNRRSGMIVNDVATAAIRANCKKTNAGRVRKRRRLTGSVPSCLTLLESIFVRMLPIWMFSLYNTTAKQKIMVRPNPMTSAAVCDQVKRESSGEDREGCHIFCMMNTNGRMPLHTKPLVRHSMIHLRRRKYDLRNGCYLLCSNNIFLIQDMLCRSWRKKSQCFT